MSFLPKASVWRPLKDRLADVLAGTSRHRKCELRKARNIFHAQSRAARRQGGG